MDPRTATTMGTVLAEHHRSRPDHPAAVDGDVRLGYAALDLRVNQLAHALAAEGVGAGDRVLWLGQNSFRVLEALLAAAKLGAMLCPANWRQSVEELAFVIDDFDARVVMWQEAEVGETVRAARDQAASSARWLQHDTDGPDGYEAFLATGVADDPDRDVDASAPVLAIYTAAFSGRPNAALISHLGFILEDFAVAMLQHVDADTVYLNSGPLFHIGSFMTTMATFHMGGTNVMMPRFDAEEFCRLVEAERCTSGYVVGPIMERVVAANRDHRYELESLRLPGTEEWNAMVSPEVTPWSRHAGGYGQTEVNGLVTFRGVGGLGEGSHGRTLPVAQLRVVDARGAELPPGEVGEIVVRGPTAMVGYHNRPDLNAERQRDGWHHTSDLGRREPDGTLTFIGPMTTMIKSGVENVYPAEVEAAIARHPAVEGVCVIGVPDPEWDQNVKAVVVRRPGHQVTEDDIIEHCKAEIASYKKPRIVEFTDALPRDAVGFVDRAAVDDGFGGGGYPGPSRTRG